MLAKLTLVVYLLASRNDIHVQYVVHFDTEAQCQTEASKYVKQSGWYSYPVQRAECVIDITKSKQF